MILLTSAVAGSIIGWSHSRWQGRAWYPPKFRTIWLVFAGFLPQFFAFYLPATRILLPDKVTAVCLVLSQSLLMIFAMINIRLPGMKILLIGLGCNLMVILANGGFMPLSLETIVHMVDPASLDSLEIGARTSSSSKDILLAQSQTVFPFLADRLTLPVFILNRFVFSVGDMFVVAGTFWMTIVGQNVPVTRIGDVPC